MTAVVLAGVARGWPALLLLTLATAAHADERVYVTNEGSGDLSVIDAATRAVVATVPLGKRPRGLVVAPGGRTLYVALSGSPIGGPAVDAAKLPPPDRAADGIGVVDTATLTLVRTLRGVPDPEQVAVSPDGRRLYVASEDSAQLFVLDAGSGAVLARVPVGGEPEGVAVSPDGSHVLVTSEADDAVVVIDAHSDRIAGRIAVGRRPRACAFAREAGRAWCTGEGDASVTALDIPALRTRWHTTLAPADRPMGIVLSRDGARVLASTGRGGQVVALDAAGGAERGRVTVGARPWGMALSADDALLYVANGPGGDVAVVDSLALAVRARIAVGAGPWGVAVAPAPR